MKGKDDDISEKITKASLHQSKNIEDSKCESADHEEVVASGEVVLFSGCFSAPLLLSSRDEEAPVDRAGKNASRFLF